MEQLLGVFLLVSLVMMVAICVPSILTGGKGRKNNGASRQSGNKFTNATFGYFDKFSQSLRVLRDLKDIDLVADNRHSHSQRQANNRQTFVANSNKSAVSENRYLHRFQPKVPAYKRQSAINSAHLSGAPSTPLLKNTSKKLFGYSLKSRQKASQLGYLRNVKTAKPHNQSVMGVASLNNYQRDALIRNISANENDFIQASKLSEFAKFEFNSVLRDVQSFNPSKSAHDIRRKTQINSALAETSALINGYSSLTDERRRA